MGLWVTALGPMSNPGRGPRAVQHGPSPCLPRGASPGLTRSESVAGGVDPSQSPGDEPAACEPPCTPSSRLLSRKARRPPGPSQAAMTRRPSTVRARFIAAPELRDSDSTGRDASGAGRQAPDNRDPSLKLRIQVRPLALPRMQAHGTRAWQGLLGGQRASVQSARIRCGWGRGGGAPAGMAGPRGWCRGGWRVYRMPTIAVTGPGRPPGAPRTCAAKGPAQGQRIGAAALRGRQRPRGGSGGKGRRRPSCVRAGSCPHPCARAIAHGACMRARILVCARVFVCVSVRALRPYIVRARGARTRGGT